MSRKPPPGGRAATVPPPIADDTARPDASAAIARPRRGAADRAVGPVTPDLLPPGFVETIYLAANPDVGDAVARGVWPSGAAHWLERGRHEDRPTLAHEPGLASGPPPDPERVAAETERFDAAGYLHLHPDLTRALGGDLAAARAHWIAHGRLEARISPGAMPHARRAPSLGALLALPFGLDVYAPFVDPGARGAQARQLVQALIAAGLSVTARGFHVGGPSPRIPRAEQHRPPGHRASLILAEPPELSVLAALYPAGHFAGSYVIAAWCAEPDAFRPAWFPAFGAIDELWVADAEAAAGFAAISPVPVRALALPLSPPSPAQEAAAAGAAGGPLVLLLSETGEAARRRASTSVAEAVRLAKGRTGLALLVVATAPAWSPAVPALVREALAPIADAAMLAEPLSDASAAGLAARGRLLLTLDDGLDSLMLARCFVSLGKPVLTLAGSPLARQLGSAVRTIPARREEHRPADGAAAPMQRLRVPDEAGLAAALRAALLAPDGPRLSPAAEPVSIAALRDRLVSLGLDLQPPPFVAGLGRSHTLQVPTIAVGLPEPSWQAIADMAAPPAFSLLLPVGQAGGDMLRGCVASVQAQFYPFWTLSLLDDGAMADDTRLLIEALRGSSPRLRIEAVETGVDPATQVNRAAERSGGTHLLLLQPRDRLTPSALLALARALGAAPSSALLYGDAEQSDDPDRPGRVVRRPDFAPEQLRARSHLGGLLLVARPVWQRLGGLQPRHGAAAGYDLTLRLLEAGEPILHVPEILARTVAPDADAAAELRVQQEHAARTGGRIEPGEAFETVRYRPDDPLAGPLSIVVVSSGPDGAPPGARRGRGPVVELVRNLRRQAPADAEILVVQEGGAGRSLSQGDIAVLQLQGARVDAAPGTAATRGALRNAGLAQSVHPLVLFADQGAVPEEALLQAMLEAAHDPAVGAVGTRLVPSLQRHDRPGHVRNVSAVAGACLLVRREALRAVHGFDETPGPDIACDIDVCLRLRAAGFRVVYTPHGSAGPAPAGPPVEHEAVQAALAAIWIGATGDAIDANRVLQRQADRPGPAQAERPRIAAAPPIAPIAAPPPAIAASGQPDLTAILSALSGAA